MKKTILFFFLLIFSSCSDDFTPVKIVSTKIDISGTSDSVLIVVGHNNQAGNNNVVTPYQGVKLPFDMYKFDMQSGDTLYVLAIKPDSVEIMKGQIIVDGNVVVDKSATFALGLKYIVPFP